MIGDKSLGLVKDTNSTPWLMDLVWNTAMEGGWNDVLSRKQGGIEDDHLPFLDANIPCVDIIRDFPPSWHTERDTLDTISATSMEKVGRLVLAVLPLLERRLAGR